jgi:hypothetical protein
VCSAVAGRLFKEHIGGRCTVDLVLARNRHSAPVGPLAQLVELVIGILVVIAEPDP